MVVLLLREAAHLFVVMRELQHLTVREIYAVSATARRVLTLMRK
jgi:hypothetical protein